MRAVLAVGTAALVELLYARVLGAPPTLAVLLGAIVAMLVSTLVSEPSRTTTLRTMAGVPVAASVGATLGVVTSAQHLLGLLTFVMVSFAAVWVRRFGPRWFTYGFLAWQGFFFALFLHPPLAALPFLVGAIVVASAWVGLLLLTVLRGNPRCACGVPSTRCAPGPVPGSQRCSRCSRIPTRPGPGAGCAGSWCSSRRSRC